MSRDEAGPRNVSKPSASASARFLALGDSYTIGEGVPACDRWPFQLAAALRSACLAVDDPAIIATTGWTTDELRVAIDASACTPPFALVSLLIGVNNQYRGRDLDNYRGEFAGLLATAVSMAGAEPARVVVVSIPDWGVTPFAADKGADVVRVADEIDRFNAINRELAEGAGAHWVDVTAISRGAGRDLLVADGLHPSAAQYAMWTARILPVARQILAGDS
jgi:lysophospholipase L1-like esterase